MITVEISLDTELFKSVELYLGDVLEMLGHLVMKLEGETTRSLLIHIMVLKCMCTT